MGTNDFGFERFVPKRDCCRKRMKVLKYLVQSRVRGFSIPVYLVWTTGVSRDVSSERVFNHWTARATVLFYVQPCLSLWLANYFSLVVVTGPCPRDSPYISQNAACCTAATAIHPPIIYSFFFGTAVLRCDPGACSCSRPAVWCLCGSCWRYRIIVNSRRCSSLPT